MTSFFFRSQYSSIVFHSSVGAQLDFSRFADSVIINMNVCALLWFFAWSPGLGMYGTSTLRFPRSLYFAFHSDCSYITPSSIETLLSHIHFLISPFSFLLLAILTRVRQISGKLMPFPCGLKMVNSFKTIGHLYFSLLKMSI